MRVSLTVGDGLVVSSSAVSTSEGNWMGISSSTSSTPADFSFSFGGVGVGSDDVGGVEEALGSG